MGLILPKGPDWAYCSHNMPASIDASLVGTAVTTSDTANTDGSAVTLLGALTHDVEYLRLMISGSMILSRQNDFVLSLLRDPAGGSSWSNVVQLYIGGVSRTEGSGQDPAGHAAFYDFPIWIPAGTSLGVQARTAHAAETTLQVLAFAFGGNANPASWWCGQRITGIGVNAAASGGQIYSAGNSNTFSSWGDLGSPLLSACGALQYGVGGPPGTFYSQNAYVFEFGVGGVRIGPPLLRANTSTESGWSSSIGPIFKSLAAGTQLQVRGACSGSAQGLNVAAYAVH